MKKKHIDRIYILPLFGKSEKFDGVDGALEYLKTTSFSMSTGKEPFVRLEVQLRYSHGIYVDVTGGKSDIVEYLENVHKVYE